MNFTHRENLLFLFFLLSQFAFPIFQEKEKCETGSFFTLGGPKRQKPARPSSPRARRPHPGRNLGLGRQSALPRAPAWAGDGLINLGCSCRSDGCASILREQNRSRGLHPETLGHLAALLLSLRRSPLLSRAVLSSSAHPAATESETASERAVERAWRRRRPPRRRACSPTGEHTAVERPGRGAPRLGSSSPASTKGWFGSSSPAPAKVGPSPFSLLPRPLLSSGINPWWGWGQN